MCALYPTRWLKIVLFPQFGWPTRAIRRVGRSGRDVFALLPPLLRAELCEAIGAVADRLEPGLMDLEPLGLSETTEGIRGGDFGHLPAAGADQVNVILAPDLVVAVALPKPDRTDHPQVTEEVEGPIDGGKTDVRVLRAGAAVDLSRVEVGVSVYDPKEELPLRGEPLPGCGEPLRYPLPHRVRHPTSQRFDPDPPRHPAAEGELRPVYDDQKRPPERPPRSEGYQITGMEADLL